MRLIYGLFKAVLYGAGLSVGILIGLNLLNYLVVILEYYGN